MKQPFKNGDAIGASEHMRTSDTASPKANLPRRQFLRLAATSPLALSALLAGCGGGGGSKGGSGATKSTYRVSFLFNILFNVKSESALRRSRSGATRHVPATASRATTTGQVASRFSPINDRGDVAWETLVSLDDVYTINAYLRRADGSDALFLSYVEGGSNYGYSYALNNQSQIAVATNVAVSADEPLKTIILIWENGAETARATLDDIWFIIAFNDNGYVLLSNDTATAALLIAPDGSQTTPAVTLEKEFASGYQRMNNSLAIIGSNAPAGMAAEAGAVEIVRQMGAAIPLAPPGDQGGLQLGGIIAEGLNNTGAAFGNAYSSVAGAYHGVRWRSPNYTPEVLQPLFFGGDTDSNVYNPIARGINDSGVLVGDSSGAYLVNDRAVLWPADSTVPKDLNTLIASGTGWVLNAADSINKSGQIVGSGQFNGQPAAFLLTPA